MRTVFYSPSQSAEDRQSGVDKHRVPVFVFATYLQGGRPSVTDCF
ncbi:MAG: hypothetical protein QHH10_11185 [Peptococcaceae bacterium]|nr:hypothetical protein [Peptococcaceae bacterium]MDH7525863.1 hypothetical protein [Peptococcaceae bacterium]